jgi:spore coat-associated protein N
MSRLAALRRHPKRTLTGLAAVLAAVGVAIGSGADFSASSSNTGNSLTAGTLSITNGTTGSVLNIGGLKPGGTAQTSTVDILNGGNLSGSFSLSRGTITDTPSSPALSGKLDLVVSDCGLWTSNNTVAPSCSSPSQLYSGTLSAFNTSASPLSLGTFAGSDKHRYQFSVALNSSADNTYQGGNSTVDLNWSAAQS